MLTGISAGELVLIVSHGNRRSEPREVAVVDGEVLSVPVVLDK
jgi:hypothetical protein